MSSRIYRIEKPTILFKKNNVDPRKSFTRPLTKRLITSDYNSFETIQLLSETFFATSNNNNILIKIIHTVYTFIYHSFIYVSLYMQKYPWIKNYNEL